MGHGFNPTECSGKRWNCAFKYNVYAQQTLVHVQEPIKLGDLESNRWFTYVIHITKGDSHGDLR